MGDGQHRRHHVVGQRLEAAPDLHVEALAGEHLGRDRTQQSLVMGPARLPEGWQAREQGGQQDQAEGRVPERGRDPAGNPGQQLQAVRTAAADWSPSSSTASSRILYFWTLPLIVIGHISAPWRNFQ